MIHWFTDWLTHWLTDSLTDSLTHPLTSLKSQMIKWRVPKTETESIYHPMDKNKDFNALFSKYFSIEVEIR